jgi:flagellar hook assembly protein FlgD
MTAVQDREVDEEDMGKEENGENLESGCYGCKATAKQDNQEIRKLERSSKTVKRDLGKVEL